MPNHVRNVIRMKGITKLPLFSDAKETFPGQPTKFFDFEKLVPRPEDITNTVAGSEQSDAMHVLALYLEDLQKYFKVWQMRLADRKELHLRLGEKWTNEERRKEYMAKALRYIANYLEYGATDWYEWSCTHWGTKWNSYDLQEDSDDQIRFSTAWSAPEPVIAALAKKYPEAHIEHWWADEDYGNNTGYREYSDGCVSGDYYDCGSSEAYENAAFCWEETECLYQDELGIWRYRTMEELEEMEAMA